MFGAKPPAPAGGLSINTNSANSLFGGSNTPTSSSTTPGATGTSGGGLFGNKPGGSLFGGGTQQPASSGSSLFGGGQQQNSSTGGGLFGNANTSTSQPQTGSLFGGSTTNTSQPQTGGGLFGSSTAATSQPQSGGLFSGTMSAGTNTQSGNSGGGLFGGGGTGGGLFGGGNTTNTSQAGSTGGGLFGGGSTTNQTSGLGGLGSTAKPGGLFGGGLGQTQQQQQQAQKPTLSLFGNQNATTQQPAPQTAATGTVVQGVKVDLTNLLPTTKYESCADEIRQELEKLDDGILNQIKMCNEVSNMIPSIAEQGQTIPNDVDYVQGKLETMQHALENDASDIDQLRSLVTRDAAEAQVAFRAIDTLQLPLQYQSATGGGWWSAQDQKLSAQQSLRSTRKNTLALPDDVESDPSTATSVHGVPVNLVDYFSQRSDEMGGVLERYTRNLKEIEDHLHGVESTLERQIHDFVTSRSRDGNGAGAPRSMLNDLAAVLGDVEAGILGVASRLGGVNEQVQEVVLGPPIVDGRYRI